MATRAFPAGFLWGSATSAHQVEGGDDGTDWWDWEQVPGHIRDGRTSRPSCEWYRAGRFVEDLDRARSLALNAHRLSLEWARLEPREGCWDAEALAYYRRVLAAVRERGMTPLVTLHHFTNPGWIARAGGWESRSTVGRFARYARRAAQELGDLCDFWLTVNEPNVYAYSAYIDGTWPPARRDMAAGFRVLANLVRAHALAYHAIHAVQPTARVGAAHHFRCFVAANPSSPVDRLAAGVRDYLFNQLFFRALIDGLLRAPMSIGQRLSYAKGSQDFIGVNYYFAERVAFDRCNPALLFSRGVVRRWPEWAPSFAGDVSPCGLYRLLVEMRSYGLPIYVAENGVFDCGGDSQAAYLVAHVAALQRAITAGAPLAGYFYWTLVDNFERAEGYVPGFGLFANDLDTQRRRERPSARVYRAIASGNGLPDDLAARYGGIQLATG
jgi:beta-glucosidase